MKKKNRDQAVVVVVRGVTGEEADKLTEKFSKAKRRFASKGRASIAKCSEEHIGRAIRGGDQWWLEDQNGN